MTTYTYDKANHLTKIADADSATNGVTDYTYDNRGLLESETFPAGVAGKHTRRTYTYDNGRRLWTRTVTTVPAATPALNEVTTYTYDNANRLIGRSYNDGLGNDTFAYDHANRLTQAVSGRYGATVDRAYTGNTPAEQAGRLTSETLTLAGQNAGSWQVAYQYDAANRLATLTYPTSDTSTRTYTSRNQLDTVTFAGATVATRTYDDGGRLATTTFGNSLVETRTYRSDANGVDNHLATQVIPNVTDFSYTYDANKRITQETNNLFANQTQQFLAYDNANRLTSWQRGTDTQTWTLSKVGDWQSTTINGMAQSRTHSAVHEIATVGLVPLSYDLKGNLTQNLDGALYGWDSENRLVSATVTDTDYGVNDVATYRYDALGRRVQKTVYGMTTTFVHAGAQVIHEFDAKVHLPASAADDDGDGTGQPPGGGILQGAGVTRYNFQPSLSPIPPGFFADKGKVYDVRSNGKSYGWLTTARTDTVIRNQHPLPQFDSFNQAWLNNAGTAGTWEIALANGTYAVVVVMGDAASANQTDNITIEGQAQTDPDPAVATPPGYRRGDFDGYAVTANVTDGRLTLAFPATANNPKLCFIEIGAQGSSITQADRDRLAAAIEDASSDTGLPAFPKAQPTPRQYVYGTYVDEPLLMRANGTKYYYASNRLYTVAAITNQTGQVVERYKYDAYGKQAILADNGSVAYKPSDYGQFHGFTGRYHDWETGLTYFRARYFDHSLDRFMGRDPAGYIDGVSLYSGYFVPNGVDPSGLLLIAVDGTGSEDFLGTAPRTSTGRMRSHTRNFYDDYSGVKAYWHGPKAGFWYDGNTGSDSVGIHAGIMKWLKENWCKNQSEPIDLVGHSRGGYIVMEVARTLQNEGIDCGGCKVKPRIRFMGLYDPVDSAPGFGEGETVPANVDRAEAVFPSTGGSKEVTIRGHTYRLPEYPKSRPYFNRADHGAENQGASGYHETFIPGTHAALGGDPWGGDHPGGLHSRANDNAAAQRADEVIRQSAQNAGINVPTVVNYGY
jgi:RHS repeat-associated protein